MNILYGIHHSDNYIVNSFCRTIEYAFLTTGKSNVTIVYHWPTFRLASFDVSSICCTVAFSLMEAYIPQLSRLDS